MKVIIAGSRILFPTHHEVTRAIKLSGFDVTDIVSGGATGVDTVAIHYAIGMKIPYKVFDADWESDGKSAGPKRNKKMADYADALIAFPGGRGTNNMVEQMKKKGKPVYVVNG